MTGGTAGYIHPALAIAELVKSQDPSAEILFAGTPGSMEAQLAVHAGL